MNDLTDADVLIHVLDGSGSADNEGNAVLEVNVHSSTGVDTVQPLNDIAWIHNELIEWVFANLVHKWDTVLRRGRSKLAGMFSGYGQTQAVTLAILNAVEKYMNQMEHRDRALDHLDEWDEGDIHRLVSAFLGLRFPMALAINKCDIPSSAHFIKEIEKSLPIHGAHVGIPLSARCEMQFVRRNIQANNRLIDGTQVTSDGDSESAPFGVWRCLQSALALKEPILVFPVADFNTYAPMPGLLKQATLDPSLPNKGKWELDDSLIY